MFWEERQQWHKRAGLFFFYSSLSSQKTQSEKSLACNQIMTLHYRGKDDNHIAKLRNRSQSYKLVKCLEENMEAKRVKFQNSQVLEIRIKESRLFSSKSTVNTLSPTPDAVNICRVGKWYSELKPILEENISASFESKSDLSTP